MQTPAKTPKRKLSKSAKKPYAKRQKQLVKQSTGSMYVGPATTSQYVVKPLRYSQRVQFTSTAGGANVLVFNTNSLVVPVAGGHQPRGFDQWALLYNRYVVQRAKITAHFVSNTATSGECVVGINVSTVAATGSDIRDYLESRYVSYGVIGDPSNVVKAEQVWNYSDWKKGNIMSDDICQATVTQSPNALWYFNVFGADLTAAGNAVINAIVTVEYEARFFDARDPTIS